jgi:molybdenum cofactor synthesis domain-containing protein
MQVALLTVGDELLAGEIENTNATWLARSLTARGVDVVRILTLPDEETLIARYVEEWSEAFDAVVTTGGLGGTHDDLTMAAVAAAFDRPLVVDEDARADVVETIRAFREANPELVERHPEIRIDVDAQASIPEGSRVLTNPVGLSPGCVVENVYVLPGIPEEMRAMFETVAEEFGGDAVSETLFTPVPEGGLTEALAEARDRFDVGVGSYPSRERHNRLRVVGTDRDRVRAAAEWLRDRVEIVDGPHATLDYETDEPTTGDATDERSGAEAGPESGAGRESDDADPAVDREPDGTR